VQIHRECVVERSAVGGRYLGRAAALPYRDLVGRRWRAARELLGLWCVDTVRLAGLGQVCTSTGACVAEMAVVWVVFGAALPRRPKTAGPWWCKNK